MGIETEKYIRKPLYVDAVRITEENFDDIAETVPGRVETENNKRFIRVFVSKPLNPRQTQAFVGDWMLWTERGGWKVYTHKAFQASFDALKYGEAATSHEYGEEIVTPPVPIEEVAEGVTPQGEPHEVIPATPEAIADIVNEQQPPVAGETVVEESAGPSGPDPTYEHDLAEGKRVLSRKEQAQMDQTEIQELIRSGEAVLEQDLAA